MKGMLVLAVAVTALAACGGGQRGHGGLTRVVGGPINSACLEQGRKGATIQRCSCVQSVANQTLSGSDQRLGASFFGDPHAAQEIRQSSSSSHSAFWKRWRDFGDQAAKICT